MPNVDKALEKAVKAFEKRLQVQQRKEQSTAAVQTAASKEGERVRAEKELSGQ